MVKPNNDHEKSTSQLIRELQEARTALGEVKWRPVPAFPALEVAQDGAMRLTRVVTPSAAGVIQVQSGGSRLSCSARTAHKAAWPELWPVQERAVDLRPSDPPVKKPSMADRLRAVAATALPAPRALVQPATEDIVAQEGDELMARYLKMTRG